MIAAIVSFLKIIPPWLAVTVLSALPVTEIRAGLPVAREIYHFSWPQALFWSILGNLLPILPLLLFLESFQKFLVAKLPFTGRFFNWLFTRTRDKFIKKYEAYGAAALIISHAIPLPLTGVYTGCVAAFVLGIPVKRAAIYISIGVLLAALEISLILLGFFGTYHA